MANSVQILEKIARNMKQRGYASSVTRVSADELLVDGCTVTYEAKQIQSPMGGVDGSINPYLGVGVAAPGLIKIEDDGSALAAVIDNAVRMTLLAECAGKTNDIIVAGSDAEARIAGQADVIGLGE